MAASESPKPPQRKWSLDIQLGARRMDGQAAPCCFSAVSTVSRSFGTLFCGYVHLCGRTHPSVMGLERWQRIASLYRTDRAHRGPSPHSACVMGR